MNPSQGLVKVHGPEDMRTELKDVSVFRMDVHMPLPPDGGLQVTPLLMSPLPETEHQVHLAAERLDYT